MATLKLEIVTPEEKIYSEDVEMVTLPGFGGRAWSLSEARPASNHFGAWRTARR